MNARDSKVGLASVCVLAVVFGMTPPQAQAGDEPDFAKLIEEKAPPTVSVKFVLKIKSSFGDQETESESTGVLIDSKGLVLCSNSGMGGFFSMRLSRAGGTVTPTDIKVLIGDDTEGLEARIVARDTDLDLIWLRIDEPGDKTFPTVDMSNSAKPKIGDHYYTVDRLSKFFGRVSVVYEGRLGGFAKKPRELFIPTVSPSSMGMPAYNAKGEMLGFFIVQMPSEEEMEAGMFSFGGVSVVLLPTSEVVKATERAKSTEEAEEEME